jgi:ABC-2 type transport system permease protein
MIAGALAYYLFHSWRNRLVFRLNRLRQPKYLLGALVGGLYFYWYIFHGLLGARRAGGAALPASPEHRLLIESAAALGLMAMMLLAWIVPRERAALSFTEAEVAFLFPAPVSRQTLIHFKLLKSQIGILFSALIMTLIGRWGGGNFLMHAVAWWAVLSTLNLHDLGSSFARTLLMDRGISNWKRRLIFLGATGLAALGIGLWIWRTLPQMPALADLSDSRSLIQYARAVLETGPLHYLLAPFRLVIAPIFAASAGQFLLAMGPALLIMGLNYLWVARSNVAFEEASLALSQKTADRIAAMRAGNWQSISNSKKPRRAPFELRPNGFPAVALFWKNLISAGHFLTGRGFALLVSFLVIGGVSLRAHLGNRGVGIAIGSFACGLIVMSLFSGPQLLRQDLRQDLVAIDVLKTYPMPGWQIVLGEVLAPTAALAGAQWLLLIVALLAFPSAFHHQSISALMRLSVALAAALLLPLIDLIALLLPNGAALVFPAWVQLGKESVRGFETTGQQLILMIAQLVVMTLGLVPAAIAYAVVLWPVSHFISPVPGVLLAALAAAAVLACEAALAVKILGGVFERFDSSGELRSGG